ncbi:glycosyltransferase family 2 protein, partial [Salmonella enterica subsp. enterica serovar Bere]|nr:glycosyltransferase family 2 protein [Salmonella enterica subsp. enterica serovar Bere]
TVMLAGLPMILGLQLILAFIGYDISNVPNRVFHNRIK